MMIFQVREMEAEEVLLKNDIQDIRDQNELLEFRILELEVITKTRTTELDYLMTCDKCSFVFRKGSGAPLS